MVRNARKITDAFGHGLADERDVRPLVPDAAPRTDDATRTGHGTDTTHPTERTTAPAPTPEPVKVPRPDAHDGTAGDGEEGTRSRRPAGRYPGRTHRTGINLSHENWMLWKVACMERGVSQSAMLNAIMDWMFQQGHHTEMPDDSIDRYSDAAWY